MEASEHTALAKCRGVYNRWTPEERLQIGRACSAMGAAKAARELSKTLNKHLSRSTVRNIHRQYLDWVLNIHQSDMPSSLPTARRGRRPVLSREQGKESQS